jgi:hypothetical protein
MAMLGLNKLTHYCSSVFEGQFHQVHYFMGAFKDLRSLREIIQEMHFTPENG